MEKYEFREVIGSGNYGTCHLVMHRKERRPYVAKKIPVHKMAQRGEALAEAQLLSKLRHPNIIAYKESFLEEETESLCIVTAYAEEGDLFTHIRRAREARRHFSERQVLDWTSQIALALDHIHGLRVMHRDLKTQNIFLGRGGVVKLGDFGISRVLERTDDFATTVAGTPYYLSPEVCTNQPYTLKSDVWSFGCVAYEIATLRHAFAADSLLSLVYQIVNGTCPPIPANLYDPRFVELVGRLLERDARRRPSVRDALRTDVMQEHLARMQTEGLGRPRSAHPRSTTTTRKTSDTVSNSVESVSKSNATPREAMAERRRRAAEAREAVLREAAAEQKNVAREVFQRHVYRSAMDGDGDGDKDAGEDASRPSSRSSAGWEDEVAEFAIRASAEYEQSPRRGPEPGPGPGLGGGGDGSYSHLATATSWGAASDESSLSGRSSFVPVAGGGESRDDVVVGFSSDEWTASASRRAEPAPPPAAGSGGLGLGFGFRPPSGGDDSGFGDGAGAGADADAGVFSSRESNPFAASASDASDEMCFSPPPGAMLRVDATPANVTSAPSRYADASSVRFSSGAGSGWTRRRTFDAIPEERERDRRDDETGVRADSSADVEAEILAALTLDAEADVRADAEASLVAAFAARHAVRSDSPSRRLSMLPPPTVRESESDRDGARASSADADATPRNTNGRRVGSYPSPASGEARTVSTGETLRAREDDPYYDDTFEAYDSAEETAEMLSVAARSLSLGGSGSAAEEERRGETGTHHDRDREPEPFRSGLDSRDDTANVSAATTSRADDARLVPPPTGSDAGVIAARAGKVARLRAMCGAQLGDAFDRVHAFLRSARRREADDSEVKARLAELVGGDGAKLTACFAVDMLCFEEQHLFTVLEEVRPAGTYAPGVGYMDGRAEPNDVRGVAGGEEERGAGGGKKETARGTNADARQKAKKIGVKSPPTPAAKRRIALPGA